MDEDTYIDSNIIWTYIFQGGGNQINCRSAIVVTIISQYVTMNELFQFSVHNFCTRMYIYMAVAGVFLRNLGGNNSHVTAHEFALTNNISM